MIRNQHLRTVALAAAAQLLVVTLLTSKAQAADPPSAPTTPQAAAPQTGENPNAGAVSSSGGELQQVVVTGYLIPRVGEGPQPVTSYDREYIDKTGYQTVTDVLLNLPGAVGNLAPNTTTGFSSSPGAASIGLKGLPPNDTLTLVDGLRFPQYPLPEVSTAAITSFVDINSIPIGVIDRIEILNDGGSATYGTDAVAGVVNLILKSDYQGAEIYNYWGESQRGDAETYHGYFVSGLTQKFSDTSKLNVVAAIDYFSQGPIMQQDRAFTQLNHSLYSPKYPASINASPTYTGQFTDSAGFFQTLPGTRGPTVTPNDFSSTAIPDYNDKWYQLQPRESRLGGTVKLTYDVTDWLKFYDSLIIERNEELSSYQNEGVFPPAPGNSGGVFVPASNPWNPFGQNVTMLDIALNEFGPFRTDTTITTFRNVMGATVQLPHGWYIDGNFLYGESDATETVFNNFSVSGLQQALNGTLPGNVGQFFNPFTDQAISAPNRAFYGNKNLVISIWQDNRTDILQYHLVAGGPIYDLPSGSITVAGGLEYRSESYVQNEDPNSKYANVTDYQFSLAPLTSGKRYIWSIFGELDIPIIGGQWSWPGLRDIDVVLSERQDYYSDFGSAAKPKFAFRYKPFNDFTFRMTYSEGFVAPSLPELFASALPAETSVNDPVTSQNGVTVITETLGNTKLKPENSYTYYIGGVWNPGSSDPEHSWWGWANGFSAYFNWFQIDQHNVIGTLLPQEIVDLTAEGAPPPGSSVMRDATGKITEVISTYENLGDSRTQGIEFGFQYNSKEYNWGKVELAFDGSYLYSFKQQTAVGLSPNGALFYRVFDFTDVFPIPDLKFLASLFYSKTLFGIDTFKTGITLHYVGSETDIANSFNNTNPNATLDAPGYIHLVGNWTTFDWQISYEFGKAAEITPETPKPGYNKEGKQIVGEKAIAPAPEGSRWGLRNLLANTTLTFGINNIFDTRPPFSSDWYQGYDTQNANYIQRFFWVSIDKKF
ncbi:MAG: TonB-dependent receptor [Verrucomicrobia bacterium]|nr:TonB-dependent receptor [Verrucomicrobiota bacterium]MBV8481397.1 TonB-dependent receptor [Verrucomicrobiota bacterium]